MRKEKRESRETGREWEKRREKEKGGVMRGIPLTCDAFHLDTYRSQDIIFPPNIAE